MNKKGQIFSLDFLLSLILVILAFGLVLNFIELHEYSMKEEELRYELKAIGEKAGDLLVSSPFIVCELYDETETDFLAYLNNCLGKFRGDITEGETWGWWKVKGGKLIDKNTLGIPSDYGCEITLQGISFGSDENIVNYCYGNPPPGLENIYVTERTIVVYNGTLGPNKGDYKVEKSEFEGCIAGACNATFDEGVAILKVWKE